MFYKINDTQEKIYKLHCLCIGIFFKLIEIRLHDLQFILSRSENN